MNRTDVVPEVLWTPSPERVARAAITDFTAFVAERTGRELAGYQALWEFSTQDLPGFWSAIADYFGVRWHASPTAVLPEAVMPGADWFPGGTLNYAEHALAARGSGAVEDPAVIAVTEDGAEQLLTLPQLRRHLERTRGHHLVDTGQHGRRPDGRRQPRIEIGRAHV